MKVVFPMANGEYDYVKAFDQSDVLLAHIWICGSEWKVAASRFVQVHARLQEAR